MARIGFVIMLLFGLVFATPVVCVCGPTDHGGQALHSLLPHTHEHLPTTDLGAVAGVPAEDDLWPELRNSSVSAQGGAGAGALAGSGAIGLALAQPWQLGVAGGKQVVMLASVAPAEPPFEPPGPPPRQILG